MGISLETANFLRSEHNRGVNFERVLCLGRQSLHMTSDEYRSLRLGGDYTDPYLATCRFFESLGAKSVQSMDNSAYEGADIVHDLNKPFVSAAGETWTCVFDGGSLEHVFNFPVAIKSCLEATAIGGTFISITPWAGLAGHGFYQFCPDLFYRILSENNGFRMNRLLFHRHGRWYAVSDPQSLGRRLEFQSLRPLFLYASASKVANRPIFDIFPQQSDYQQLWTKGNLEKTHKYSQRGRLFSALKSACPSWIADLKRRSLQRQTRLQTIKRTTL